MLLLLAMAVAVATVAGYAHGGTTHTRTGVAAGAPRMPETMIACFGKRLDKYIDKTQPANCEFAGYEGQRGRKWMRISIDGIRWNEWGVGNTPGSNGMDPRGGAEFELFAYRRIRCGDGRTFYSRASAINLKSGDVFHLRLPICDDPTP
jgi:hypothetical protein